MAQEHLTYAQGTGFRGHVLHAEQDKREGEIILEWIRRLGFQADCPLWQVGREKRGMLVAVAYPAAETPPPSASGARPAAFTYVVVLQQDDHEGERTDCIFVRDAASLMDLRLRLLVLDAAAEG